MYSVVKPNPIAEPEIWFTRDGPYEKYVDAYYELLVLMVENGHSIDEFTKNPHFNDVVDKLKVYHPEYFI